MPVSIELKPEVEERLGREAPARGVSVEAYVEDLIEQQVVKPHEAASRINMEELDRVPIGMRRFMPGFNSITHTVCPFLDMIVSNERNSPPNRG
jgi:hypothetical protein